MIWYMTIRNLISEIQDGVRAVVFATLVLGVGLSDTS